MEEITLNFIFILPSLHLITSKQEGISFSSILISRSEEKVLVYCVGITDKHDLYYVGL